MDDPPSISSAITFERRLNVAETGSGVPAGPSAKKVEIQILGDAAIESNYLRHSRL
jgi:hypothetical protein